MVLEDSSHHSFSQILLKITHGFTLFKPTQSYQVLLAMVCLKLFKIGSSNPNLRL